MPPVDFNSKILFIIFIKKEVIDDLKSTFITLNMLFSGQQLNIKTTVKRTASLKPKWVSVKVPRKGALNIEMGRYGDSKNGFG